MTSTRGYRTNVLKTRRPAFAALAALAFLAAASAFAQSDTRGISVDFILLVDKSKSMDVAMPAVKRFLAGDVIGPLVAPGDRVRVLAFYGKTETLWSGSVEREEDKSSLVRSLNAIKPDGRFTDIGQALDAVDGIIAELNAPERPKYILLVTDERQEAPEGTKYYAPDYKLDHPYLTYVKREDKGAFRVITVGYGLDAKIDAETRKIATILTDPPARQASFLPGSGGSPAVVNPDGSPGVAPPAGSSSAGATPTPGAAAPGTAAGTATPGRGSETTARTGAGTPAWASPPLVIGGIALLLALGGAVAWAVAAARKRADERGTGRAA